MRVVSSTESSVVDERLDVDRLETLVREVKQLREQLLSAEKSRRSDSDHRCADDVVVAVRPSTRGTGIASSSSWSSSSSSSLLLLLFVCAFVLGASVVAHRKMDGIDRSIADLARRWDAERRRRDDDATRAFENAKDDYEKLRSDLDTLCDGISALEHELSTTMERTIAEIAKKKTKKTASTEPKILREDDDVERLREQLRRSERNRCDEEKTFASKLEEMAANEERLRREIVEARNETSTLRSTITNLESRITEYEVLTMVLAP